jgi:hypothetical protein
MVHLSLVMLGSPTANFTSIHSQLRKSIILKIEIINMSGLGKLAAVFLLTFLLIVLPANAETMTVHSGTNVVGIPGLAAADFANCSLLNYDSATKLGCKYNKNGYFVYYNSSGSNKGDCGSNFYSANSMKDGLGYYLYASTQCQVSYNIPTKVDVTLRPGTNIISVPVETSLDDIAAVCGDKTKIFSYYDSSTKAGCKYNKTGYFVYYNSTGNSGGDCDSNFFSDSRLRPFVGYYVYFKGKNGDGTTPCAFEYENGVIKVTTTTTTTTTTTIVPSCDSTCKTQGYSSGTCISGGTTPTKSFDYGLWCDWLDVTSVSSEFLSRIGQGKIDVLIISTAEWRADNTLSYLYSASQLSNFKSQVLAVNPNMKFYADILSFTYKVDFSTSAARQKAVDEVAKFVDNYGSYFDGIEDDSEYYTGAEADEIAYFNLCAAAVQSKGMIYYPWVWFTWLPQITSLRSSYGPYGGPIFPETEWKAGLDYYQAHANVGFGWYMGAGWGGDSPTIRDQLKWFDDQLELHGESYYSKLEIFGIWWYPSMTDDDWDAWISWVNTTNDSTTCSGTSIGQDGCSSGVCCCSGTYSGLKFYGADDVVNLWWVEHDFWTYAPPIFENMHSYGANWISVLLTYDTSNYINIHSFLSYQMPTGETGAQFLSHLSSVLHSKGMYLELQPYGNSVTPGYSEQVVYNLINNVNGEGDAYISLIKQYIDVCDPDMVHVFSESAGVYNPGFTVSQWIDFCDKAIDAWRTVNPNLLIGVQSVPFWDLAPIVNAGGVPRPNVIYFLHDYYSYLNTCGDWSCNMQWQYDYGCCGNGNLAAAKAEFADAILNGEHLQAALDAGFTVAFEAIGTNPSSPNAVQFCADAADFSNQYGLGYIASGYPTTQYSWIYPNGVLNSCGQALFSRIPKTT